MMLTHPRLRQLAKRTGAAVSVLILLLYATSLYCCACWGSDMGRVQLDLRPGLLEAFVNKSDFYNSGFRAFHPGLRLYSYERAYPPDLWIFGGTDYRAHCIQIPLWMPFIAFAAPTFWLWRQDRRRIAPGHCRTCGYNLTGNTSGRCPECGRSCKRIQ